MINHKQTLLKFVERIVITIIYTYYWYINFTLILFGGYTIIIHVVLVNALVEAYVLNIEIITHEVNHKDIIFTIFNINC